MRFVFCSFLAVIMLISCHKSLAERAEQECKDYTEKRCPTPVVNETRMDSMVYEHSTNTIHYYYTLMNNTDNEILIRRKDKELKKALKESLDADTGTKIYKDAGFKFRYSYYSFSKKNKLLLDVVFDYE